VSAQIHIERNGERFGPYSLEDANSHLASGTLQSTDLAWSDGMQSWVPIGQIPGIIITGGSAAPPPTPAANIACPNCNAEAEPSQVVCMACGTNLKTGAKPRIKKIKTGKKKLLLAAVIAPLLGLAVFWGIKHFSRPSVIETAKSKQQKKLNTSTNHLNKTPSFAAPSYPKLKLVSTLMHSSITIDMKTPDSAMRAHEAGLAGPTFIGWAGNSKVLISDSNTGILSLWDALTGKELYRFIDPTAASAPKQISFSNPSHYVDIEKRGMLFDYLNHHYRPANIAMSPDGTMVAVGGRELIKGTKWLSPKSGMRTLPTANTIVMVWNAHSGRFIGKLDGPAGDMVHPKWSSDSRLLACISTYNTNQPGGFAALVSWNWAREKPHRLPAGGVEAMAEKGKLWIYSFNRDRSHIIGYGFKRFRSFNRNSQRDCFAHSWSPRDYKLYILKNNGIAEIKQLDVKGNIIKSIPLIAQDRGPPLNNNINWSSDGTKIQIGNRIFDTSTGKVINHPFPGVITGTRNSYLTGLLWSPDGTKVATTYSQVLDTKTGKNCFVDAQKNVNSSNVRRQGAHLHPSLKIHPSFSWSPDGTKFIRGDTIYQSDNGEKIHEVPFTYSSVLYIGGREMKPLKYSSYSWSPDGTKIMGSCGLKKEDSEETFRNGTNGLKTPVSTKYTWVSEVWELPLDR